MKSYKGSSLLPIILLVGVVNSLPSRKSKPEDLIATDSQIQFSDTNGEFKTSVNTDNSFRTESRSPDGSVKGVYGWISPGGKPIRVAFKSDAKNGYRTFKEVNKLNVELPPLPSKLYASESNDTDVREEKENAAPKTKKRENILPRQRYRIPQEARNAVTYKAENDYDDDNFVVLEEDAGVRIGDELDDDEEDNGSDEETAVFLEQGSTEYDDDATDPLDKLDIGLLSSFEGLLSNLEPGTPVAQSNPSATAISGEQGVAQVSPSSSAIVGPGGVAISLPTGQALVGPGGISISAPKSSSQAGPGGVAIAGITSSSVAGITSGAASGGGVDEDGTSLSDGLGGDPGFFKRHAGAENPSSSLLRGAAAPIIANYFFQFKLPEYYGAANPNTLLNKFYSGRQRKRNHQISGRRSYRPSRTSPSEQSSTTSRQQQRNVRYEAPDLQSLSKKA